MHDRQFCSVKSVGKEKKFGGSVYLRVYRLALTLALEGVLTTGRLNCTKKYELNIRNVVESWDWMI